MNWDQRSVDAEPTGDQGPRGPIFEVVIALDGRVVFDDLVDGTNAADAVAAAEFATLDRLSQ